MKNETTFRFKAAEIGKFLNADYIADLIIPNVRILGLTDGKFSLIDLIYSILKKIGKSNVYVATWSAGIKDAHQVKWLIDTDLIESFKIFTDHSYVNRQKKYVLGLNDLFGAENIYTSEMHAKFVLIKNDKYSICIRTSMNLNANKTCESFEIDDDTEIYKFYWSFLDHVIKNQKSGFISNSNTVSTTLRTFFENIENKKQPEPTDSEEFWKIVNWSNE
jgi:hypothetical protein